MKEPQRHNMTCLAILRRDILKVVLHAGFSVTSVASGMATMNAAGHRGYSAMHEALASQAVGFLVCYPAMLALSCCCMSLSGKHFEMEEKYHYMPSAVTAVAVVIQELVGYSILNTVGKTHELSMVSAVTASALGVVETLSALCLLVYCCCFPCLAAINDEANHTLRSPRGCQRNLFSVSDKKREVKYIGSPIEMDSIMSQPNCV